MLQQQNIRQIKAKNQKILLFCLRILCQGLPQVIFAENTLSGLDLEETFAENIFSGLDLEDTFDENTFLGLQRKDTFYWPHQIIKVS